MGRLDSSFARLVIAWSPALQRARADQPRPIHRPQSASESSFASTSSCVANHADGAIPLLIVTQTTAAAADLALRLQGATAYRVQTGQSSTPRQLESMLRGQGPRLLLIDSQAVRTMDVAAMRAVARASPATVWLLLWHEATPRDFELALACRARGCIEWDSTTEQFIHAFRTVLGGELWFPRRAMELLYASLLAATQPDARAPNPSLDVTNSSGQPDLTAREVQVLALLRQGLSNKQIADRLAISIHTVKKHLAHAFEKRGLHHRRQLHC